MICLFFCYQHKIFAREAVHSLFFYNHCVRNVMDLTKKQSSFEIFKMCAQILNFPPLLSSLTDAMIKFIRTLYGNGCMYQSTPLCKLSVQHNVGVNFLKMFCVLFVIILIIV